MEIERIELYPLLHVLARPYGDANGYKKYRTCFLFRIITRSGLDGWGECIDWLPTLMLGFEQRIIPFLIGKQATNRLQLVKIINKWHQRAAAGVSMALTEILAKKAAVSISELWGGRQHQTIPVYASFQSYTDAADWKNISLQRIEQAVSDGFRHLKVKIGGRTIREDQDHIIELQKFYQDTVQLALDANQSYDAAAAFQWERLFREWPNLMWLEEPLPMDRWADYKLLRTTLSVPLAGGENLKNARQFLPLLMEGALDMIQPDTMHHDGLDSYRDSLQLARQFGVRASSHAFDGALSRLYAIFAQACLPPWSKMEESGIEPVEWDVMENPFTRLFSLRPVKGAVQVPDGIGLGVEVDQEMLKAFRWDGRIYK
ncbi:mandelate racemase/muconate lactonizing enzyme family protein [Brevibacillus humidisoli]|uniref:mandelate racemase/muconate lactonizing enzyme family protein n=1 Tax=Brevibacillus humidisoli TaxID=2895522 RepID=UPI001E60FC15|nr:mandelate racemase/muconate lactonizing enzyme family protein [Brevibacillus humidisoli]UFJ41945.1 mandelate racemase/muconate lactonizing enzyme family protein [Brevibacillus humidisoli]